MGDSAGRTPTDGELLAAFAESGNESAFAALTERHQVMVFNACLRVLREHSDAEDAAQAVFLALTHKAREQSLQQRASLAGWLYEAAWHISVRVREAERLRKRREQEAGTMHDQTAAASTQWAKIAPLLDGELNALPEHYRTPIILHHLESRSVEETAQLVHCSTDAAKQRLSRGREMLKDRLVRRGLLIVAGAPLLTAQASAASAPAGFAAATAKSAMLVFSGKAIAASKAAVFAKVAADAVSHAETVRMIRGPMKVAAAVVLAGVIGGASWWMLGPSPAVASSPQDPKEIEWGDKPEPRGVTPAPSQPSRTPQPNDKDGRPISPLSSKKKWSEFDMKDEMKKEIMAKKLLEQQQKDFEKTPVPPKNDPAAVKVAPKSDIESKK